MWGFSRHLVIGGLAGMAFLFPRVRPVTGAENPAAAAEIKLAGATAANRGVPASSRRVRLETMVRSGRGFVAELEGGAHAELTLDPRLQDAAEDVFRDFDIPYGAAVVLSVPDGRVLALAGRSSVAPELGAAELTLQAWAPAAQCRRSRQARARQR